MGRPNKDNLLGESAAFLEAIEQTSKVAKLNKPVLIIGERGSGKELFAARLHFLSQRWAQPFIKFNCAAISDTLLETELFGHEAGAFTGATKRHIGRFEQADQGTLFLDEVANTSQRVQEKLLRVIEYGEFERVGGNETLQCDIRLIAATNEDLPTLVSEQRFRADLLDRLAFDVITLPPLRVREQDILLLSQHFAIEMTKELGRPYFPGFSLNAEEALLNYPWPGNVRELKNVIERNVYKHDSDDEINSITFDPFESPYRPLSSVKPQATQEKKENKTKSPEQNSLLFPIDYKELSGLYEQKLLRAAMQHSQHNQKRCAKLLGLTYHQLRAQLKKHKLI